jgi:hypothetical protein
MQKHVQVLGWLYLVYHAVGVVIGFLVFFLLAGIGILSGEVRAAGLMTFIGLAISIMLIALCAPGIIAGIGILARKEWARILAVILAILHLLEFPFGTAFGGYALWVLFNPDAAAEFR